MPSLSFNLIQSLSRSPSPSPSPSRSRSLRPKPKPKHKPKTKTKTKTKNIIQESAADAAAQNKIDVRVNKFYDSLVPFLGTYDKKMLRNFFDYWSEPNRNNTKMKWELERTWKTDLRLKNWKNREETRGTMVIKNRNSWTNYDDNNKHFEQF